MNDWLIFGLSCVAVVFVASILLFLGWVGRRMVEALGRLQDRDERLLDNFAERALAISDVELRRLQMELDAAAPEKPDHRPQEARVKEILEPVGGDNADESFGTDVR